MIQGFEDCSVFHQLLDKHHGDFGLRHYCLLVCSSNFNQCAGGLFFLAKTLVEFSQERPKDCQAMCDLALYNFFEMCDHVNTSWYRLRKKVDSVLNKIAPNTYIPLYTMVWRAFMPIISFCIKLCS
jgi:hypothetical protein